MGFDMHSFVVWSIFRHWHWYEVWFLNHNTFLWFVNNKPAWGLLPRLPVCVYLFICWCSVDIICTVEAATRSAGQARQSVFTFGLCGVYDDWQFWWWAQVSGTLRCHHPCQTKCQRTKNFAQANFVGPLYRYQICLSFDCRSREHLWPLKKRLSSTSLEQLTM